MNLTKRMEIREMYKHIDTSIYSPYPIDWVPLFTPIEYMVWCDIRDYPINMWPQYPVGKYFADFANVQKKIVIECDGKQWHDEEKDAKRDAEMIADGWTVYRIPGYECNRVVERDDYENEEEYWKDLYASSSGVIKAIHYFYFKHTYRMDDEELGLALRCLNQHRATGIYKKPVPIMRGFE